MGKIVILDETTANQIAAGEVIERPASVVKEMVENAVDAGATQVTVEIRNGGVAYIRVADNGSGIEADDVEMAFERHGTSKIRKIDDLDTLATMGFRGEALASIASVSRLELVTRTQEMAQGLLVKIEGGRILETANKGCSVGTQFTIKDLFYNTPARYKFLKKDATEAGNVTDVLTRLALCHPDVSMRLISNGEEVFHTPGNNDLMSTIYSLYGREVAQELLPLAYDDKGIRVTGFVGKPNIARGTRARQSILMNRRFIRNTTVTAALDEAFKTLLMTRQYAFAVIHLQVSPQTVDVNVHPAKLEVRFSDEGVIFSAVHHAVKNALLKASMLREQVLVKPEKDSRSEQKGKVSESIPQQEVLPGLKFGGKRTESTWAQPSVSGWKELFQPVTSEKGEITIEKKEGFTYPRAIEPQNTGIAQEMTAIQQQDKTPISIQESSNAAAQNSEGISNSDRTEISLQGNESVNAVDFEASKRDESTLADRASSSDLPDRHWQDARIIGQVLDTYLVLEAEGEMLMIDQHAAHERIRYEMLRDSLQEGAVPSQGMLAPMTVRVSELEYAFISDKAEVFSHIGFDVEPFGKGTVLLRGVPDMYGNGLSEKDFLDIVDAWMRDPSAKENRISDELLFQMSCKGAIKANRPLDMQEMTAIVSQLAHLENPYTCVHGRPVIIRFSEQELEKRFKRIV